MLYLLQRQLNRVSKYFADVQNVSVMAMTGALLVIFAMNSHTAHAEDSHSNENSKSAWRAEISKGLFYRPKYPSEFLRNSEIGLAYLLADRLACPQKPNSRLNLKGSTMHWYTKESMLHDFKETCHANFEAKQDLISIRGEVQSDVAQYLFKEFKEMFLSRYEARTGLKPHDNVKNYAELMAQSMVDIRIEARRQKLYKHGCDEDSASAILKSFEKTSRDTEMITELQHHLDKSHSDCDVFFDSNWKPWTDKPYTVFKDTQGKSHPGIVASLPKISNWKRHGIENHPTASPVEIESESGDFDVHATLANFGNGNFPVEKYHGRTLFSKADYEKGLMPGVPYVPTSAGGTKSNDFSKCKNVIIITHRTCSHDFGPTPAHFTVGQNGEIMQHGPVQNAMPGAKGHNNCSIHVELAGAYKGKKLDAKGKKTHQNLYQDLTAAQTESAASVYAFISYQLKKAAGFDIKLEHAVDSDDLTPDVLTAAEIKSGVRTKDKMFSYSPRNYPVSAVVQHSQVSPSGTSSHHDDHVNKTQMDELLRQANVKKAKLEKESPEPILTAEQSARSYAAVQKGVSATGQWNNKMYTPLELGRFVAPAKSAVAATEPDQSKGRQIASIDTPSLSAPTDELLNPYSVIDPARDL